MISDIIVFAIVCHLHTRSGLNRPEPDPEYVQFHLGLPGPLYRRVEKASRHILRSTPYLGNIPDRQYADQRSTEQRNNVGIGAIYRSRKLVDLGARKSKCCRS